MDTIGTVYAGLGLYDDATGMLEQALARRRSLPVVDPQVVANNQVQLANVLTEKAQIEEAEKLYLEAIATLEASRGRRQSSYRARSLVSPRCTTRPVATPTPSRF